MSQVVYFGLVRVSMFSSGNDMSAYMVVAENVHHGSCVVLCINGYNTGPLIMVQTMMRVLSEFPHFGICNLGHFPEFEHRVRDGSSIQVLAQARVGGSGLVEMMGGPGMDP